MAATSVVIVTVHSRCGRTVPQPLRQFTDCCSQRSGCGHETMPLCGKTGWGPGTAAFGLCFCD